MVPDGTKGGDSVRRTRAVSARVRRSTLMVAQLRTMARARVGAGARASRGGTRARRRGGVRVHEDRIDPSPWQRDRADWTFDPTVQRRASRKGEGEGRALEQLEPAVRLAHVAHKPVRDALVEEEAKKMSSRHTRLTWFPGPLGARSAATAARARLVRALPPSRTLETTAQDGDTFSVRRVSTSWMRHAVARTHSRVGGDGTVVLDEQPGVLVPACSAAGMVGGHRQRHRSRETCRRSCGRASTRGWVGCGERAQRCRSGIRRGWSGSGEGCRRAAQRWLRHGFRQRHPSTGRTGAAND